METSGDHNLLGKFILQALLKISRVKQNFTRLHFSFFVDRAAKLAEMAHISLVDHRASDSLAHGELQRERQKYEVCDHPSVAKQRRLPRQNTIEEIRRKRSKRRRKNRQEERKLSTKALKRKLSEKFRSNLREVNVKFKEELEAEKNRADENRKKAEHFWREWRKGKSLKQKEM
jgi:hypothetical protein